MLYTVWARRREYNVAQVDVYSGLAFIWAEAVSWLLRFLGKPIVLTLHGGNLPNFATRHPRRVSRLLSRATVVTSPSRYLISSLGKFGVEIVELPNAIDTKLYAREKRSEVRPKIVWLRTFHRIYNPMLAPSVLFVLAKEFPSAELVMAGPASHDGSLVETKRLVEQLGLSAKVHFIGSVAKNDVPNVLGSSDIFINTTDVDNTPVTVLEAMASGLCIVSTRVGGIPFLLSDGVDSLLVPANDANAMADAIARILTDQEFAERISKNAQVRASQWDWSAILPKWEKILEDASFSIREKSFIHGHQVLARKRVEHRSVKTSVTPETLPGA
jgi:glycosyltransferase involved in cell wall biosynthesis